MISVTALIIILIILVMLDVIDDFGTAFWIGVFCIFIGVADFEDDKVEVKASIQEQTKQEQVISKAQQENIEKMIKEPTVQSVKEVKEEPKERIKWGERNETPYNW